MVCILRSNFLLLALCACGGSAPPPAAPSNTVPSAVAPAGPSVKIECDVAGADEKHRSYRLAECRGWPLPLATVHRLDAASFAVELDVPSKPGQAKQRFAIGGMNCKPAESCTIEPSTGEETDHVRLLVSAAQPSVTVHLTYAYCDAQLWGQGKALVTVTAP